MEIKLTNKQSEEQRQSNNFTCFHFIMAMTNLDMVSVKNLLKPGAKFLGWMNEWQFCNWLDKRFKLVGFENAFHSRFHEQICMDACPGADMLVFEYAKIDDGTDYGHLIGMPRESNPFNSPNVVRISLALIFEDGKIADIRIPSRGLNVKQIKKLQSDN